MSKPRSCSILILIVFAAVFIPVRSKEPDEERLREAKRKCVDEIAEEKNITVSIGSIVGTPEYMYCWAGCIYRELGAISDGKYHPEIVIPNTILEGTQEDNEKINEECAEQINQEPTEDECELAKKIMYCVVPALENKGMRYNL